MNYKIRKLATFLHVQFLDYFVMISISSSVIHTCNRIEHVNAGLLKINVSTLTRHNITLVRKINGIITIAVITMIH